MECGRELAEAQSFLEKYELNIEELVEEKRVLEAKLKALQTENLGKKDANDNVS